MANRVNNFDLIRLFGAAQVAVSHSIVHLKADSLLPIYQTVAYLPGVPIFFAVSGFLVSFSWERAPSWRQYALNRFLRIYPALWAAFVLSLVILLACGIRPDTTAHFVEWVTAQLTIAQFYNPAFIRGFGVGVINGSMWTIPVELQFYIVVPFLAWFAARKETRWLALTIAALVLVLILRAIPLSENVLKLVTVTLLPWLLYFLVGVTLRYLHQRRPGILAGKAIFWAIAYALWVALEIRFNIRGAVSNEINPVSIVLLSALTISAAFTLPDLAGRFLGDNDISYGVYIYHMPFVNLLLFIGLTGGRAVALALLLAVSTAILSWKAIERPALALKNYSVRHAKSHPIQRHSTLSE